MVQDSFLSLSPMVFISSTGQGPASYCNGIVHPSVRVCVHKLFLLKTSPQRLLTGFLPNFTEMFLRWSSFKFFQIIVFHEEFWFYGNQSKKTFNNLLLPNHKLDSIIILQECSLDRRLQNSLK